MIHPSPTELNQHSQKKGLKIITELFNNGCMLNNSIEKSIKISLKFIKKTITSSSIKGRKQSLLNRNF